MTTVTAQQTAADLLSAANHIEQFGHTKNNFGGPGGPCCVAGAISVAITGKRWLSTVSLEQFTRRTQAIDAVQEVTGVFATLWNDEPERTKGQVVAVLREAAEAVFPSV